MKKDYIKVNKVSERLTGDPFKIRHKNNQHLVNHLNNLIEAELIKIEVPPKNNP